MASGNEPQPLVQMSTTLDFVDGDETKTITVKRVGNIVSAMIPNIDSISFTTAWETITLVTLPNEYKPSILPIRFPIIRQSATNTIPVYFVVSSNNGALGISNQGAPSGTATGILLATNLTWVI